MAPERRQRDDYACFRASTVTRPASASSRRGRKPWRRKPSHLSRGSGESRRREGERKRLSRSPRRQRSSQHSPARPPALSPVESLVPTPGPRHPHPNQTQRQRPTPTQIPPESSRRRRRRPVRPPRRHRTRREPRPLRAHRLARHRLPTRRRRNSGAARQCRASRAGEHEGRETLRVRRPERRGPATKPNSGRASRRRPPARSSAKACRYRPSQEQMRTPTHPRAS